jgi:flagellar export protein FliJ
MESVAAIVRLKEFEIEGYRRKLAQIHAMIAEFGRLGTELDREIHAEEVRSGNADPTHFAYSTFAKATRLRRENLKRSAAELTQQLEAVRKQLAEAMEELKALPVMERPGLAAMARPQPASLDLTRAS